MQTELDEDEAIRRVAEQLKSAYSALDPSMVDAAVTVAYRRLIDARIRTYVPIFVERQARAALDAITP